MGNVLEYIAHLVQRKILWKHSPSKLFKLTKYEVRIIAEARESAFDEASKEDRINEMDEAFERLRWIEPKKEVNKND